MSGYIKLYRGITDNPVWNKDPYSAGQAWIDLLLAANFKEKTIFIRNTAIKVERGQLAWSTVTMAARWKWSRNKVIRFLKTLKSEHMIEQEAGHLTTLTTICNYEKYQGYDTAGDTTDDTADGTADGTAGDTADGTQHKKVNKVKKVKKEKNTTGLDLSALPGGISEQTAKDFIEHRKLIKKPLTQRALNLCMTMAAKAPSHGLTPDQVIDEAIIKGWMKPEPEWVAKSLSKQQPGNVTQFRRPEQENRPYREAMPRPDRAPQRPTGTGGDS